MLDHANGSWFAFGLAKAAGVQGSTVYDALTRWEQTGWVEHTWEDIDPSTEGRPRRKLYRFSADGAGLARVALDEHDQALQRARTGVLRSPPVHPTGHLA